MSRPPSAEESARTLEASELDATIPRDLRVTIEPSRRPLDSLVVDALDALTHRSVQQRYAELALLGEGGMGVVKLGTQLSLDRPVALKSLRDDIASTHTRLKLLREAWITGRLEHPNIVPVHDLGIDERGEPRIVLKRIEGAEWASLVHDARAVAERFETDDLLEWNLRVLMEVARALHFAHVRGIVHRDVKPENVMLGSFGEVYVVDWGLAVSLDDDGSGRLPLARDAHELAGTPCYMAPEQWGGGGTIDARTDVYLLGATLFEVLTGNAPRAGATLAAMAAQAWSIPELPGDVPRELAAIVDRAMRPRPDDRFESAEAFRRALATYLAHRSSIELAHDALSRLAELERSLATRRESRSLPPEASTPESRPPLTSDERAVRLGIYQTFGAARFGFLEGLRSWPENELARDGLRRAVRAMIDLELDEGDPQAAEALLAELSTPDDALTARVDEAARHHREEQAALRAKSRDYDPNLGRRTRWFVTSVFGAVWTVAPLVRWAIGEPPTNASAHGGQVAATLALLTFGGGLFYWARDSMSRTAINRGLVGAVLSMFLAQLLVSVGGWIADVSGAFVHVQFFAIWAAVTGTLVATVERRLWPVLVAQVASYLVASVHPELRHPLSSLSNLALMVTVAFLWSRPEEDLAMVRERFTRRRDG